jgi:outer membrane murein-binding lipoprotein Lpp
MKKRVICAVVLGALVLAGCGSKQDVNEKNFDELTLTNLGWEAKGL